MSRFYSLASADAEGGRQPDVARSASFGSVATAHVNVVCISAPLTSYSIFFYERHSITVKEQMRIEPI